MGDADGVAAHVHEDLHLPLHSPVPGLRAQRALVVVLAHALELGVHAVELEAHVGGEFDGAEAELSLVGVHHCAVLLDGGHQDVEVGRAAVPGVPELGTLDADGLRHRGGGSGRGVGGGGGGGLSELRALFIGGGVQLVDGLLHRHIGGGGGVVLHVGLDVHRPVISAALDGVDESAVPGHVDGAGDGEVHAAVNAAAGIPTAGGDGVDYLDGDDVLAGVVQIFGGQDKGERIVAVLVFAQLVAVEVDIGLHVRAAEVDGDDLVILPVGTDGEALAVPAGAAGEVAAFRLVRAAVLLLDAEVVGEVQGAPGGVVKDQRLRAGNVAQIELPVFVKVDLARVAGVAVDGDGLHLGGSLPAALGHGGAGNGDQLIEGGGDAAPGELDLGHAGNALGHGDLAEAAGEGLQIDEAVRPRGTDGDLDAAGLILDQVDLADGGVVRHAVDQATGGLAVHVGLKAGGEVAVGELVGGEVPTGLGGIGHEGGVVKGTDIRPVIDNDLAQGGEASVLQGLGDVEPQVAGFSGRNGAGLIGVVGMAGVVGPTGVDGSGVKAAIPIFIIGGGNLYDLCPVLPVRGNLNFAIANVVINIITDHSINFADFHGLPQVVEDIFPFVVGGGVGGNGAQIAVEPGAGLIVGPGIVRSIIIVVGANVGFHEGDSRRGYRLILHGKFVQNKGEGVGAHILQTDITGQTGEVRHVVTVGKELGRGGGGDGGDLRQLAFVHAHQERQVGLDGVVGDELGNGADTGQGDAHKLAGTEHHVVGGEGGGVVSQRTERIGDPLHRVALIEELVGVVARGRGSVDRDLADLDPGMYLHGVDEADVAGADVVQVHIGLCRGEGRAVRPGGVVLGILELVIRPLVAAHQETDVADGLDGAEVKTKVIAHQGVVICTRVIPGEGAVAAVQSLAVVVGLVDGPGGRFDDRAGQLAAVIGGFFRRPAGLAIDVDLLDAQPDVAARGGGDQTDALGGQGKPGLLHGGHVAEGGVGDVLPLAVRIHVLELTGGKTVVGIAGTAHLKANAVEGDGLVVLHADVSPFGNAVGGFKHGGGAVVAVANGCQAALRRVITAGDDGLDQEGGINDGLGGLRHLDHQIIGEGGDVLAAGKGGLIMVHIQERVGPCGGQIGLGGDIALHNAAVLAAVGIAQHIAQRVQQIQVGLGELHPVIQPGGHLLLVVNIGAVAFALAQNAQIAGVLTFIKDCGVVEDLELRPHGGNVLGGESVGRELVTEGGQIVLQLGALVPVAAPTASVVMDHVLGQLPQSVRLRRFNGTVVVNVLKTVIPDVGDTLGAVFAVPDIPSEVGILENSRLGRLGLLHGVEHDAPQGVNVILGEVVAENGVVGAHDQAALGLVGAGPVDPHEGALIAHVPAIGGQVGVAYAAPDRAAGLNDGHAVG